MHIYLSVPNKLAEVKILIDKYEAEANDFDEKHELNGSKRKFYFYKGKYYEEINQLDSAEFYYRKLYHSNMPYTSLNSMNGGLFNVFSIRHQPDSIAKYAQLYCLVNDSSIAKKTKS